MSKIRKAAQGQPCTLRLTGCLPGNETVVFCHLNTPFKGIGLKSPDLFGVDACAHCHDVLDRRKKGDITDADKLRALFETQKRRLDMGLISI